MALFCGKTGDSKFTEKRLETFLSKFRIYIATNELFINLQVYGYYDDPKAGLSIVMEYMSGGTLMSGKLFSEQLPKYIRQHELSILTKY